MSIQKQLASSAITNHVLILLISCSAHSLYENGNASDDTNCTAAGYARPCFEDYHRNPCHLGVKNCTQNQYALFSNNSYYCEASNMCSQNCHGGRCSFLCNKSKRCTQGCQGKDCVTKCNKDTDVCGQRCSSGRCSMTCKSRKCGQQCRADGCNATCTRDSRECNQSGYTSNNTLSCEASETCAQKCSSGSCLLVCNNARECTHDCYGKDCTTNCGERVEHCIQKCDSNNCHAVTCNSRRCNQRCSSQSNCLTTCGTEATECSQTSSALKNLISCNASEVCLQKCLEDYFYPAICLLSCNNARACTHECSGKNCEAMCERNVRNCTQVCSNGYSKCQIICDSKICNQTCKGLECMAKCNHAAMECLQYASARNNMNYCLASQVCSQRISRGSGLMSCNNSRKCTQECSGRDGKYCTMICDAGVENCTQNCLDKKCHASCYSKKCYQELFFGPYLLANCSHETEYCIQKSYGPNTTIYCDASQVCSQDSMVGRCFMFCNNSKECTQRCYNCEGNNIMVCGVGVENCTQRCSAVGKYYITCYSKRCHQKSRYDRKYLKATCSHETEYCTQDVYGRNNMINCDAIVCSQKISLGSGILSCNNSKKCAQECSGRDVKDCSLICDKGYQSCARQCSSENCTMLCNSHNCVQHGSIFNENSKLVATCGRHAKKCVQLSSWESSVFSCNASDNCSQYCFNQNCSSSCNNAEVCTQECSGQECATLCHSEVHNCTQISYSNNAQMTCNSQKCGQKCSSFMHCRATCGEDVQECVQTGEGKNSKLYCDAAGKCTQKCNNGNCFSSCNSTRECSHECSNGDCKLVCNAHVEKCTQTCYSENCEIRCNSKTCDQECHTDGCNATCPVGVGKCTQVCYVDHCFFSCHAKTCEQIYKSGNSRKIIIATTVAVGSFLAILFILVFVKCKRRKQDPLLATPDDEITPQASSLDQEPIYEEINDIRAYFEEIRLPPSDTHENAGCNNEGIAMDNAGYLMPIEDQDGECKDERSKQSQL